MSTSQCQISNFHYKVKDKPLTATLVAPQLYIRESRNNLTGLEILAVQMPHTTTKNPRLKRVDTRPNEKRRRAKNAGEEEEKSIQDIRVTKKQKGEKVEREVPVQPMRDTIEISEDKYIRALRKKLRDIDLLLEKQKGGAVLDAQQLQKLETLDGIMEKMDAAIAKGAANASS